MYVYNSTETLDSSSITTPVPVQTTASTKLPITSIPRCPKSGGLREYENDCHKFINCFDSRRPKVKKCAPGHFFNKKHKYGTICLEKIVKLIYFFN